MKVFDRSMAIVVLIWGIVLNPFLLLQLYGVVGERRTVFWGGTPDYRFVPTLEGFWNAFLEMQLIYFFAFFLCIELLARTKLSKLWIVTVAIPISIATCAIAGRIIN
jgi:hypothetical protein